tara:strand:- start:6817 stop:7071 length:255 start_codon:yes stop_codon:yes gene_type:complete
MSLKVGDSVAWSVGSALRTGQYIGKHQYRLKQEKAPKKVIEAANDDDIRVMTTKNKVSRRQLDKKIKQGVGFVVVSLPSVVKIP